MTLENPKDILSKINSIKNNTDYLYKTEINSINPLIETHSLITPFNNNLYINSTNNLVKKDISKANSDSIFQDIQTSIKSSPNNKIHSCNNINNSLNPNEELSSKGINDYLFNYNYINTNQINNYIPNNKNKLIEPVFYQESNNNKVNFKIEKKPSLNIVINSKINLKENTQLKTGKESDKFKISHPEIRNKKGNRIRHRRKYNSDDIRKKIKARFHKSIKNIINENLRKAGSKHLFSFLPQIFISSIAREKNRQVLNLTYRELLQKDFLNDIDGNKYKNKSVDFSKYKNNLRVLDYLDKNPEICKNSGFDIISKMQYSALLEEYFKSDEFEKEITKLREENEGEDYIKEYKKKAKEYIKFFSEIPVKINKNTFN